MAKKPSNRESIVASVEHQRKDTAWNLDVGCPLDNAVCIPSVRCRWAAAVFYGIVLTLLATGCGELALEEDHYQCTHGEPGTCPSGWVCRESPTSRGTYRCFRTGADAGSSDATVDADGPVCGNNSTESGEVCDGSDVGGETCESQGFDGGTFGCLADCSGYDTSQCVGGPTCGDNVAEGDEVCDGSDVGTEDCESQGFDGGTLECLGDCTGFDTSGCWMDPGLTWVPITGGSFSMGSTTGDLNEQTVHTVTVPDFEMTETEVTVDQYEECVTAGACTEPPIGGSSYNWKDPGYENHPVNGVNWFQAGEFCSWVGGRLPTEAEWEYAARSEGQDITYPWGDETATCDYAVMDDDTHTNGCGTGRTMEVCSKTQGNTDQGLCDMAGNVWEWVEDDYHSDYNGAPNDGSAWVDDPRGDCRVRRGGGFGYTADLLRAANRDDDVPSAAYGDNGFRCARDAP